MPTPERDPSRPSPKMIRLYHRFSELLGGEPVDLWVYEPRAGQPIPDQPPTNRPTLKHVMVWPADDEVDVSTFQTIGMSERTIPDADYSAELHMGIRAFLRKPERERVSRYLANVAEYAFDHQRALDWWHTVSNPGEIPHFPGCKHLMLHPRFTEEGFDTVPDADGVVKVFFVVPITPLERHLLVDHGRDEFIDYVADKEIDLFSDRTDPAGALSPEVADK